MIFVGGREVSSPKLEYVYPRPTLIEAVASRKAPQGGRTDPSGPRGPRYTHPARALHPPPTSQPPAPAQGMSTPR